MDKNDYEKYEDLLQLKYEIDEQLNDIKDKADIKTYKKLEKLKDKLDKKHEHESLNSQLRGANMEYKFLSFFKSYLVAFQMNLDIDPSRLMGITDGIFGGVMTLLIFGLTLPNFGILTQWDLSFAIESLMPTIGITVISFILLGSFWIWHHDFFKIKNLNLLYLWFNIFFLIFISFIPFTTSLIGTFSNYVVAAMVFGINIFLTLFSFTLMYWYANKSRLMENEVSSHEKKYTYNTFLCMMILTICVIILDLNSSQHFIYLFLFIPLFSTIRDIRFKIKHKI